MSYSSPCGFPATRLYIVLLVFSYKISYKHNLAQRDNFPVRDYQFLNVIENMTLKAKNVERLDLCNSNNHCDENVKCIQLHLFINMKFERRGLLHTLHSVEIDSPFGACLKCQVWQPWHFKGRFRIIALDLVLWDKSCWRHEKWYEWLTKEVVGLVLNEDKCLFFCQKSNLKWVSRHFFSKTDIQYNLVGYPTTSIYLTNSNFR